MKSGANINEQDTNGWTIFHHIAERGFLLLLKSIFKFYDTDSAQRSSVKLNKLTNKGYHMLHIVAMNNHLDLISYLLDKDIMMKWKIDRNATNVNTD